MEGTGQHNLSIALRHILQQIVDSTNPSGQKNTDMTLPHDGYIQRLSWYFECDRCHYKAFYCHEMESHKRVCYMSLDLKFLAKKRKLAAPKRVSSTTHPPNEDSDQDSQQSTNLPIPVPKPAYSVPIHINRSSAGSIVTPSAARPSATATATSIPLPKLTQSTNIIPMEPTDIEFDPGIPSPDYDVPTIPEIDNQSQQHLDFDNTPSKDNTDMDDQHKNEPTAALSTYDPDILEIKVEVEPSNPAPRPSLPTTSGLSIHSTPPGLAPHRPLPFSAPAPSDPVFPGSSDLSIDSMMNYFATQPPQHTISTPPTSRIDHRNPAHSLPELSIGNVTSLKKPMIKHNPHALSQMPNVKKLAASELTSTERENMSADFPSYFQEDDQYPTWSGSTLASATVHHQPTHQNKPIGPSSNAAVRPQQHTVPSTKSTANISASSRYQSPPTLKWRGIQTKPASVALSLDQKFQCCQLHDSGMAMKALCLQFNQSKATITHIINNKQKIMAEWFRYSNPYITKKQRTLKSPAYAEINSAMLKWYWNCKAAGRSPTGVGIQSRAKEVAEQLGYHTFKASNGWLEYFWKRVKRHEEQEQPATYTL